VDPHGDLSHPSSVDTYVRAMNGVMEDFGAVVVKSLPHAIDQRFKSKDR
jgi:hypothetical protein